VSNYSPSRFWHLIYDAPNIASMQNAVNLGKQRGAGWLYVTPDGASGSNPWSALPSDPYWTDELDALQGIQPPTRQLQTIRFTAPTHQLRLRTHPHLPRDRHGKLGTAGGIQCRGG